MAALLRTIIIDDEAHVRDSLRRMLEKNCPMAQYLAEAQGVESGVDAIQKYQPDLVLLDIQLGDGTGFDLLSRLEPLDFKVIFITAHDRYAIKAFKFSALDYLLKPVDPEELAEAVEKAAKIIQHELNTQLDALSENLYTGEIQKKKIIVRTHENIYLIRLKNINYCEATGSYTRVHLVNGEIILVSSTLKEYDDMLNDQGFYRCHKSYLINIQQINRFEKAEGGYVVQENGDRIPVASRKREQLLEMFEKIGN